MLNNPIHTRYRNIYYCKHRLSYNTQSHCNPRTNPLRHEHRRIAAKQNLYILFTVLLK